MARINIEEKWKTDPRRSALARRIGARCSDGMLVEISWLMLAHKGSPVPLKEFKFVENYQDWIDCGLAEVDGDIVRISGASIYQDYFEKQRENGKKGGRPTKPNETQNNPDEPRPNPEKPSSSSSNSSSSKNTGSLREPSQTRKVSASAKQTFTMNSSQDFTELLKDYFEDWVELYDREYLQRETKQSLIWLKANPKKNKKTLRGWVQFYSGWFQRNWDKHTTQGPSNRVPNEDQPVDGWEKKAQLVAQMLKRHGEGEWLKNQVEIKAEIGEELFRIAIKAGTRKMRSLPAGPFYVRNLIAMLKETASQIASTNLNSEVESGFGEQHG